ncbi:hypothetical protein AMATHDRAFT_149010 [Amanita thiersii Skay4041]|uniref:F-box domain-containing protein n=1 Tax=Amanita thiersii Skay4041 TaxID=703135 RepID=A0A2A9NMD7_9AGAR|nr:hypothetical protein AMATHDRAFT_149010 [Amanita thiersii Skay4041]
MASYLETIPRDILQEIAYLCSSTKPLASLLSLLLASSSLYKCLNVQASPHLYSKLFREHFDLSPRCCPWRIDVADSVLAMEFVRRYQLLRRIRRRDLTEERLCEDLWTALWMVVENSGLNEGHLSAFKFADFIIELAAHYLPDNENSSESRRQIQALLICLLCYTLTQEKLSSISHDIREELLNLLRPFTNSSTVHRVLPTSSNTLTGISSTITRSSQLGNNLESGERGLPANVTHEKHQSSMSPAWHTVDPTSSAIILTFALKEVVPLMIPPHLPETRALALANHRSGPTVQDFQATVRCKTPLFADPCPSDNCGASVNSTTMSRNILYDPELYQLIHTNHDFPIMDASPYRPGILTGVWEGSYMVLFIISCPNSGHARAEFACRKPMQCAITEYLCYIPHLPLPLGEDDSFEPHITPRRLFVTDDYIEIDSWKYGYEKLNPTQNAESGSRRDQKQALDVILVGETLPDHEQAWGAYRFIGRVTRDGTIFLKREPKNPEDDLLGTWCFQGHLRYGSTFVGQWKSSSCVDKVQGIFSMHKRSDIWNK